MSDISERKVKEEEREEIKDETHELEDVEQDEEEEKEKEEEEQEESWQVSTNLFFILNLSINRLIQIVGKSPIRTSF